MAPRHLLDREPGPSTKAGEVRRHEELVGRKGGIEGGTEEVSGGDAALSGRTDELEPRRAAGYHGWTYALDGTLQAIPRADEGEIELSEFGLVPAAADVHKGVVFASVEPREPLLDFLGEAPAIIEKMNLGWPFEAHDDWVRVANPIEPYCFRCNWKVTVENAIECYHCPTMHTHSFSDFYNVDPAGYSFNNYDRGIFHLANFTERVARRAGLERSHEPSIDSADFRFLFSYPSGAGIGSGDPEATEVRLGRGVVPLSVHESLFFDAIVYRRSKVRPKSREQGGVGGGLIRRLVA